MILVNANLTNEDGEQYDTHVIGFFSTPEKAIEGASEWVENERNGGSTEDICLFAWLGEPDDGGEVMRSDLSKTDVCKSLTKQFRAIEAKFPPCEEDD